MTQSAHGCYSLGEILAVWPPGVMTQLKSSGMDGPGFQGTELPHLLALHDPVQTWRRKHSPPQRGLDSPGHSDHAQGWWSHSRGRRHGLEASSPVPPHLELM